MEKYNIFEQIIVDKNEEKFFEIFKNETIKIEKIVSNGQTSPKNFWYEQEKSEFILLLEGFAILEFENREVELKKGDCLNIGVMEKHRVKFTSLDEPTVWFAVFYWKKWEIDWGIYIKKIIQEGIIWKAFTNIKW